MDRLRIAFHASDPLTLAGLISYLRTRPDMAVVPEAQLASAQVFIAAADVITSEVMAVLRKVADESQARIVLVTNELRDNDLISAVECGVVAVLPRHLVTGERLVNIVQSVRRGHGQLPSDLLGKLLGQVERVQRDVLRPKGLVPSGLAQRERQVLRLLSEGLDTAEIAKQMSYSERTVKNIVQSVLSRLQLRNRAHAVAYALRAGVI